MYDMCHHYHRRRDLPSCVSEVPKQCSQQVRCSGGASTIPPGAWTVSSSPPASSRDWDALQRTATAPTGASIAQTKTSNKISNSHVIQSKTANQPEGSGGHVNQSKPINQAEGSKGQVNKPKPTNQSEGDSGRIYQGKPTTQKAVTVTQTNETIYRKRSDRHASQWTPANPLSSCTLHGADTAVTAINATPCTTRGKTIESRREPSANIK